MAAADWVEIGRIVAPQGLRGEVRVYPSSDFPQRFLEPGPRWIQRPKASTPEPVHLLCGRWIDGKGLYVVQLEGIGDRTQAEALRGCTLLVPASDRPRLEAGDFYVADLVGLRVILQETGQEIGLVTDIYEAGNDLLEVTLHSDPEKPPKNPKTALIPFVESIVPVVDVEQGFLQINPPIGLLER